MKRRQRLHPTVRKEQILDAALTLSQSDGYQTITRQSVATLAGCSEGLVSRYFSTMPQLRRAVMSAAIAQANLSVLAQGIAMKDAKALRAPEELRRQAVQLMMGG